MHGLRKFRVYIHVSKMLVSNVDLSCKFLDTPGPKSLLAYDICCKKVIMNPNWSMLNIGHRSNKFIINTYIRSLYSLDQHMVTLVTGPCNQVANLQVREYWVTWQNYEICIMIASYKHLFVTGKSDMGNKQRIYDHQKTGTTLRTAWRRLGCQI